MSEPHQGHRWNHVRGYPGIRWCVSCGHVPLRNAISTLVTTIGCNWEDHPTIQAWRRAGRKALTRP